MSINSQELLSNYYICISVSSVQENFSGGWKSTGTNKTRLFNVKKVTQQEFPFCLNMFLNPEQKRQNNKTSVLWSLEIVWRVIFSSSTEGQTSFSLCVWNLHMFRIRGSISTTSFFLNYFKLFGAPDGGGWYWCLWLRYVKLIVPTDEGMCCCCWIRADSQIPFLLLFSSSCSRQPPHLSLSCFVFQLERRFGFLCAHPPTPSGAHRLREAAQGEGAGPRLTVTEAYFLKRLCAKQLKCNSEDC